MGALKKDTRIADPGSCLSQSSAEGWGSYGGNVRGVDFLNKTESNGSISKTPEYSQKLTTEVVVVGAGGGGTWTAIQCARRGVKVLVVEKGATWASSNTSRIGGTTACHTSVQKDAGIDADPMAVYEHMMRYARGTVNGKIVRRYLKESGEMLDYWMNLGVKTVLADDRYNSGFTTVHFYLTPNKMELLQNDAKRMGVEFLFRTTGKSVIMEDGKAVGITAEDKDGNILEIRAKYVVIATGGFLNNPEMMKRYFGEANTIHCAGMPFCTGDGIQMAVQAGAIMDTNFALSTLADASGYNAKYSKIGSFTDYFTPRFQAFVFGNTGTILVDNQGKRFINEQQLSVSPLAFGGAIQARVGYYYAIVDQALVDYYKQHSPFERLNCDKSVWRVGGIMFNQVQDRLDKDIDIAIDEGFAWRADTVEELAAKIDMPYLAETISNYNRMYDEGTDDEFGCDIRFMVPVRKGPFYAVQYQCAGLVTMGGIKTDDICRALNKENQPIDGLFVVSSDNGSAFSSPYYDIGGTSSGLAMGTGWIAGEEIAKLLGKPEITR